MVCFCKRCAPFKNSSPPPKGHSLPPDSNCPRIASSCSLELWNSFFFLFLCASFSFFCNYAIHFLVIIVTTAINEKQKNYDHTQGGQTWPFICVLSLLPLLLPQSHTHAPLYNRNLLLLSRFQEEAARTLRTN